MTHGFLSADGSPSAGALDGVVLGSGATIGLCDDPVYVYARHRPAGRTVALVSGGGAGHEPLHASFVGAGGLDAACPGEVFTSPHNRQIYAASSRVAGPGGVLHIVKNYTGDRINFAIAAERLRADGFAVSEVLVDDDLGTADSGAGRRGTGAAVVVEKVLGAAADTGMALDELTALGRRVAGRSRSIAVAKGAHTRLADGAPAFAVGDGELEFGVGIHGEAGVERIARPPLEELAGRMVDRLVADVPPEPGGYLLLVNGLGGTSNLELLHVLSAAHRRLARSGRVRGACVGTFVSALDMPGFSLTVTAAEDAWLPYWFAVHQTPGLPSPIPLAETEAEPAAPPRPRTRTVPSPWLDGLATAFTELEARLNHLDQRAGDGDFGTNMRNGFTRAARRATAADPDPAADLTALAGAFLDDVGGSSGPLFGLLFQEIARALGQGTGDPRLRVAGGLRAGYAAVARVGGAQVGDRTLLDAVHPVAADGAGPLTEAGVRTAIDGARGTAELAGHRGRAGYLGRRVLGVPDPGAVAAGIFLVALWERLTGEPADTLRATALDVLPS